LVQSKKKFSKKCFLVKLSKRREYGGVNCNEFDILPK
jgi:hypothetical protein